VLYFLVTTINVFSPCFNQMISFFQPFQLLLLLELRTQDFQAVTKEG